MKDKILQKILQFAASQNVIYGATAVLALGIAAIVFVVFSLSRTTTMADTENVTYMRLEEGHSKHSQQTTEMTTEEYTEIWEEDTEEYTQEYTVIENIETIVAKEEEINVKEEDALYDKVTQSVSEAQTVTVEMTTAAIPAVPEKKKFTFTVAQRDNSGNIRYGILSESKAKESEVKSYCVDSRKISVNTDRYGMLEVYVMEEALIDENLDETYVKKAVVRRTELVPGTGDTGGNMTGGEASGDATPDAPSAPQFQYVYYVYTLKPYTVLEEREVYTGWYQSGGSRYYYDAAGRKTTGYKKIDGLWYYFDSQGRLSSMTGIDVSSHQGEIDWNKVAASGIDFVIIRACYRGYSTGKLVEDSYFRKNIEGATKAGLKVGLYVFSQAVNVQEAVEEASLLVSYAKGYNVEMPLVIDVESKAGSGRQDRITVKMRTAVINAFESTVRGAGYQPMLYSNLAYLKSHIDTSKVTSPIWLARYTNDNTTVASFPGMKMWQFTSSGRVNGIKTNVDLNIWIK